METEACGLCVMLTTFENSRVYSLMRKSYMKRNLIYTTTLENVTSHCDVITILGEFLPNFTTWALPHLCNVMNI
jgi:hypothetical protein